MEPVESKPELSWPTQSQRLRELFAENILAKVYRTAQKSAQFLPSMFPEYVAQQGDGTGSYHLREADFWTCGFFPGILHSLLERSIRYPQSLGLNTSAECDEIDIQTLQKQLRDLCKTWAEPLHSMATRTDTHDIGFIIMPALRIDWELNNNAQSLGSIITAAQSLASRYIPSAGVIRSWDLLKKKDIEIISTEDNAIIIIDSLCNLDLLYYAAANSPTGGHVFYDIATKHATTLMQTHLRPEKIPSTSSENNTIYKGQWYSTCHVTNLDPKTGELKRRLTAQGYADESTWSRGQSWAILGYAQTYVSTKDVKFLQAACGCAEYFLHRMETAASCVEVPFTGGDANKPTKGRYTPLWDFDAPVDDPTNPINPLRDSSAGMIAANGMLILSQSLAYLGQDVLAARFRRAAMDIAEDILHFALATEKARLVKAADGAMVAEDAVVGDSFEGILKFGTANNNANARKRYANHTLVYGDYYMTEFGNRLLRMGLV